MTNRPPRDTRLAAARYRVDRLAPSPHEDAAPEQDAIDDGGQATPDPQSAFVEISIQQAMRRGDFDDLPGTGRPLPDLGPSHDPDWWIKQKIEREGLTGLGPPALTLRTEDAGLDERLDALGTEDAVQELLEDFNARVIEARRQLLGGPPVITRPREVGRELARWRQRRDERRFAAQRQRWAAEQSTMTWRERRRARRSR